MKSMQLIDKQRVLNIVTAMNIVGYTKDPYVEDHKITTKERIFALNFLANEILNQVGIDSNSLIVNIKKQSKDKNSEAIGFANMGFNAGIEAAEIKSGFGGFFEENVWE